MGSKKKIWILWGWRILAINILIYPMAEHLAEILPVPGVLLLTADVFLLFFLFCKYKSMQICLEENTLTFAQGILLRRTVRIRLNQACATKRFSSPLSRKLNLCNLVIFCEGVRFLLPPISKSFAAEIQKHARKAIK